jgi:hypothetical protein
MNNKELKKSLEKERKKAKRRCDKNKWFYQIR